MHRSDKKHRIRKTSFGIMTVTVLAAIAVAAAASSCSFDSETNLCEAFERRCPRGQTCALHQDACIEIGGCGDGVIDPVRGEVCDDGNIKSGDHCSADCRSDETCGNRIADFEAGESCDDGNTIPGDGCDAHCQVEVCGDHVVNTDSGEICDDGNTIADDGCSANCKSNEACGNGMIDNNGSGALAHEDCDPGDSFPAPPLDTADCNSDCTSARCGDGHINKISGEECDEGSDNSNAPNARCRNNCHFPICGDGITDDKTLHEKCDDGNHSDNDDCPDDSDGSCQPATCGDGFINRNGSGAPHEECDPPGKFTCFNDDIPVKCDDNCMCP